MASTVQPRRLDASPVVQQLQLLGCSAHDAGPGLPQFVRALRDRPHPQESLIAVLSGTIHPNNYGPGTPFAAFFPDNRKSNAIKRAAAVSDLILRQIAEFQRFGTLRALADLACPYPGTLRKSVQVRSHDSACPLLANLNIR